jgi:acyl-CoA thioester hydrolase
MTATGMGRSGDRFSMEFRIGYADCDGMGYLHHARYWEYFERVRTELLRANGFRYRDLEEQGVFFVVHKCACTFIRPVRYDDLVTVTAKVERITRTRVDHSYEFLRGDDLLCQATTTLACVGRDGKPRLAPDALWAGAD